MTATFSKREAVSFWFFPADTGRGRLWVVDTIALLDLVVWVIRPTTYTHTYVVYVLRSRLGHTRTLVIDSRAIILEQVNQKSKSV